MDRSTLKPIFGDWASWPHEDRVQLFEEVLTNHELRTFISPKEIDSWVALYTPMHFQPHYWTGLNALKNSHYPFSNAYSWRTEGCQLKKTLQRWSLIVLFLFLIPNNNKSSSEWGTTASSKIIKEPLKIVYASNVFEGRYQNRNWKKEKHFFISRIITKHYEPVTKAERRENLLFPIKRKILLSSARNYKRNLRLMGLNRYFAYR